MPYITQKRRKKLISDREFPQTAGELNFMFSVAAIEYLESHGTSYQTLNDVIGALEGCKLEFYRRVANPYEDIKIGENGDVY